MNFGRDLGAQFRFGSSQIVDNLEPQPDRCGAAEIAGQP
jgi:hypothetical protein